jgi:hypothetical protein
MRQALAFILFIFLTFACSDLEQFETPTVVNLGAAPTKTNILSVISTGGTVTAQFSVTTGAKYSVQVYEFGKTEPTKTLPLTAEEEIVTRVYDFTDLQNGLYDITLTDVAGISIKKPLIIKR